MFLKFLTVVSLKHILNTFLYCPPELKSVRYRLKGKSIRIILKEFYFSLILIFKEYEIDILNNLEEPVDCSITMNLSTFLELRDYRQLILLVENRTFKVKGDFLVIHNFFMLISLSEFDLAELIVLYTGDVFAEIFSKIFCKGISFLKEEIRRQQYYISEILNEELKITPGSEEVAWFIQEIADIKHAVQLLDKHIENWIVRKC